MKQAQANGACSELPSREEVLVEGLSDIAAELGRQLQVLASDGQLVQSVADLPDAQSRLAAVVEMTEKAAHQTLDLVDSAKRHLQPLVEHQDSAVKASAGAIRQDLIALSEAQAYQDLSGQMINRVSLILGGLQGSLRKLLDTAGVDWRAAEASAWELPGPASNASEQARAVSQGDADELMEGLGL